MLSSAWSDPDASRVEESYAEGAVTLTGDGAGGFVGYMDGGYISDVYARGAVTANNRIGGLIGEANGTVTVQYGYATGSLAATNEDPEDDYIHGFIGDTINVVTGDSQFYTSFFDQQTNGGVATDNDSGSLVTAYPKNTNQMTTSSNQTTFTTNPDPSPEPGDEVNVFDFEDIWTFVSGENDDYPMLQDAGATEVPLPDHEEENGAATLILQPEGNSDKAILVEQLEGTEICDNLNDDAFVRTEPQLETQDSFYDYASYLVGFTMTGCEVGGTTTMRLIFTGEFDPDEVTLRKYNSVTRRFTTVTGAEFSSTSLNDLPAIEVAYEITDGGELDQDGEANGEIVDPVGLGTAIVGAPNTGLGGKK